VVYRPLYFHGYCHGMKTEKEKMLSGESYIATDKELVQERSFGKSLLKQLNQIQD
jgi:hypothetical protein